MVKCSKCIDYFRQKKRKLELIYDLKAKSESFAHAKLKNDICHFIREFWKGRGFSVSAETEVSVEGIGRVDVVGSVGNATIAVECGRTSLRKIEALKEHFDVVLHIPYCHTWNFLDINMEKIEHQLFTSAIATRMEKDEDLKGWTIERNKVFCLEEGECSLPSGRNGYPEEAIEIACSLTEHERES